MLIAQGSLYLGRKVTLLVDFFLVEICIILFAFQDSGVCSEVCNCSNQIKQIQQKIRERQEGTRKGKERKLSRL